MSKAIVCCSCGRVPSKAKAAYTVMAQDGDVPDTYVGKNSIYTLKDKLSQEIGSECDICKYLSALANNREKFAYYFEWGEDGALTAQYNLLTGRRLI